LRGTSSSLTQKYFDTISDKGNYFKTLAPDNSILVAKIQKEALGSSFLEAFLESAPQIILQLYIVQRNGLIGKKP
jgi:hypothetical protein